MQRARSFMIIHTESKKEDFVGNFRFIVLYRTPLRGLDSNTECNLTSQLAEYIKFFRSLNSVKLRVAPQSLQQKGAHYHVNISPFLLLPPNFVSWIWNWIPRKDQKSSVSNYGSYIQVPGLFRSSTMLKVPARCCINRFRADSLSILYRIFRGFSRVIWFLHQIRSLSLAKYQIKLIGFWRQTIWLP